MPTSATGPATNSSFEFALAVVKSLRHFQVGVIRLAEVHDAYSRLQAGLFENPSSTAHEQVRQVLSECLSGSVAASESIWRAAETLGPFERRSVVFAANGKPIKSTVQDSAAGELSIGFLISHAYTEDLTRFIEESSAATDEGLFNFLKQPRKVGDETIAPGDIREELLAAFRRICKVFAETGFREHLRITSSETDRLAAHVETIFGDPNEEIVTGRPSRSRFLREPSRELLRPLVKQILDSAQGTSVASLDPDKDLRKRRNWCLDEGHSLADPGKPEPMPSSLHEGASDDPGLQFVWVCPQCARHVPRRVHQCRCGYTPPSESLSAAVLPKGIDHDDATRESPEIVHSHGRTGQEAAWVASTMIQWMIIMGALIWLGREGLLYPFILVATVVLVVWGTWKAMSDSGSSQSGSPRRQPEEHSVRDSGYDDPDDDGDDGG